MRNLLFYVLVILYVTKTGYSQEIVYTISAEREGSTTYIDSILIENLDNKTRFLVGNLPDLPQYDINLNSQELVTSLEQIDFLPEKYFGLIKNTPGEASIQLFGNSIENTTLNIFNVVGQKVFSQTIPLLDQYDIITVSLPKMGTYILNLNTGSGPFNFRVIGSTADLRGVFKVSVSSENSPVQIQDNETNKLFKNASYSNGFSFQSGDTIRVTVFLDGYYTYPYGTKISGSKSIPFKMLKSTAEITGISDRYKPIADEEYTILEYDPVTGRTSFQLLSDTIEFLRGDILTIDLDTIGLIQRVVSTKEVDGEIIVETELGYMDELFVNASFKLDTRMIEPKSTLLQGISTKEEIIEALTDDEGYIHPVQIIYHDSHDRKVLKSVLDDNFTKDHRVNIISLYENFSGTDLYGTPGDNVHFYIDQGYVSLTADGVFEFDFKYTGELTEDTKVKRSDIELFKFHLDADADFQTRLALDMNRSMERQKKDRLFRMRSATAKFYVPPTIPVWITFNCDIYSDYYFNADTSLNANWGFESTHSAQAGGMYEKASNDFSPIWEYEPKNTVYPFNLEGEVNAHARLELYPRTDIRFYGFFGPYAEIVPFVEGKYNAAMQSQITSGGNETFLAWNSGIDLGLDLRVGTSMQFLLGQSNRDFGPNVINCFNSPLWASPVDIELLTEIPEEIEADMTLELQVKVTDHLGLPVPLCAVYFEGDGVFSKQLPVTDAGGIVTINWTPENSAGIKEFTSTIFKADNEAINSISGSTTITGSENREWKLVWEDDFEEPELDPSKWTLINTLPSEYENAPDWQKHMISDDIVYAIEDGKLYLEGIENPGVLNDPRPFLTGGVHSRRKFSFLYGKIEIRAKKECAQGAWPALWMMPEQPVYGRWPNSGEIDIMEHLNYDSTIHHAVHTYYTNVLNNRTDPPKKTGNVRADVTQWNVYGLEWYPDVLIWTLNGEETFSYPRVEGLDPDMIQWPFDQPFYIILSQQLGGSWVGEVKAEELPVSMIIDYVRVYQQ